jgi:hypothetical protein
MWWVERRVGRAMTHHPIVSNTVQSTDRGAESLTDPKIS